MSAPRTARRAVPAWRTASLAVAAVSLAVALGPLDAAADRSLSAHMVQHALVALLAPALLAAAAPVRLALARLGPRGRRRLAALLHPRALSPLRRPAIAVPLAAGTLAISHLPGVLDAVERHGALHALDHAALFWTAALAWASLLGADPVPAAPGAIGLLVAVAGWMAPMAFVGALYANGDHVLVGAYAAAGATLADQHDAGTVMWLLGPALMAPFALGAFGRALWLEEHRQRRREQAEGLR